MGYETRISKAFEGALKLPLSDNSKYVLFSDCHRGVGTSNDNFLKNQHLYFAALQHYYQNNFTYIELGDGDELWENRSFNRILEIHSNVFWLLVPVLLSKTAVSDLRQPRYCKTEFLFCHLEM